MIKKLNLHPYPINAWFCNNETKFYAKRKEVTGRADLMCSLGLCSRNDAGDAIVIGVFNGDLGVLVHEVTHLVTHVFEYIGADINAHTTEPFAYLIESVFNQTKNMVVGGAE